MRGIVSAGIAVFCLFFLTSDALSATYYVPDSFSTIQAALDGVSNGDTIIVRDGMYKGVGNKNLDFKGKAVTLQSENGPNTCIIDCENNGRGFYFHSVETSGSVVDGFSVIHGNMTEGGGILCYPSSSPTITNCTISNNYAYDGAGIYCRSSSSPVITNCSINRNTAGNDAGGIYCRSSSSPAISNCVIDGNSTANSGGGIYCNMNARPAITDSTISGNSAFQGGGIKCWDSSSATITGCAITGNSVSGSLSEGGGVYCGSLSSPIFTNCHIAENSAENGGGISTDAATKLINCTISRNSAMQGGGMCFKNYSYPSVSGCSIIANGATKGGGLYCSDSNPTITNCSASGNSATDGAAFYFNYARPTITNCTFSGNAASGKGGGIYCRYYSAPTVINCILWNDTAASGPEVALYSTAYPSSITVSYSDVTGGAAAVYADPACIVNWGSGNINANPQFVAPGYWSWSDWVDGDYHLTAASPCIDAATPTGAPNRDIDGETRPQVQGYDIGSDEFTGSCSYSISPETQSFDSAGGASSVSVTVANGCPWTAVSNDDWITITSGSGGSGNGEVTYSVSENLIKSDRTGTVVIGGPVLTIYQSRAVGLTFYVPDDYPTIQAALDGCQNGDIIAVRNGTYKGVGNKNLDFNGKSIRLCSEGGAANCIIDCEKDGRGFFFHTNETSSAVVDGFTIVNGSLANVGGAIYASNASPTIINCVIAGNSAHAGGAISFTGGAPAVANCVIKNNTSVTSGGGIYCYDSSATIINCTFSGNTAQNCGGAIYCELYATVSVVHCTITGNKAENCGGGVATFSESMATLTDCIVWDNFGRYGMDIALNKLGGVSFLSVNYSDIKGGQAAVYVEPGCVLTWGNGNFNDDPLFVEPGLWYGGVWVEGDYHLTACSPCIDSGTDAGINTDIDGNARPSGPGFDIGSDEFAGDAVRIAGFVLRLNGDPIAEVLMNGLPDLPLTLDTGYYCGSIPSGTDATVTPSKFGFAFDPSERIYTDLTSDQLDENYIGYTSGAMTFTSIPADDGWILESTETSNVGGLNSSTGSTDIALRIGDDYGTVTQGERQYKSIVSFDTSSIPDGAVILSATLKLTGGRIVGKNPLATHGPCYVDIKTGTFGSQTLENSDFQATATATKVATMPAPPTGSRVSTSTLFNAAGLAAINKMGLTQMKIYLSIDDNNDKNDDYVGCYSGENSAAENRPVLEVTYQQ